MQGLHKKQSVRYAMLLLVIMLGGQFTASAQIQQPVTVQILDNYSNPITGVILEVNGIDSVLYSDNLGNITFTSGEDEVLYFKHRDYYTLKIKRSKLTAKNQTPEVWLTKRHLQDPEQISVLYDEANSTEFLGSISSVYTGELETVLAPNAMYALPGKLTGLYTQQTHGFGESPFSVSLRGMSPVVMVDGVQRDLTSIDLENIESISVQKDALSTILLGMRSSRGLLMITTKEPDDEGFQLSFTTKHGISSSLNIPDPLSSFEYAYELNEALLNDGLSAAYSAEDFTAFKDGTDNVSYPDVNWYERVLNDQSSLSSYNLNISGGGKTAQYYLNMGYYAQDGLFSTSEENSYNTNISYDRYLINSKFSIDVTDDFKIGGTIMARLEEEFQPGTGFTNLLYDIYNTPNVAYPVVNPDESYGGNVSFTNNILSQTINSGYIRDNGRDAMVNLNLDYDLRRFIKGLKFKAITNLSVQSRTAIRRNKRSLVYEYTPADEETEGSYQPYGSQATQSNYFVPVSNLRYFYAQVALEYEKEFDDHYIDAKLLWDRSNVLINYDLPQQPMNIGTDIKYNYKNKYFAEGAVSYSYFNRYKPGNQWGLFYAAGLGWLLSEEDFLADVSWIDLFKVKVTYGKTGNGIDNSGYYGWRQTFYSSVQDYSYSQGYSESIGTSVIENKPMYNPERTWEKGRKLDVGANISMFDKHINIRADYYYNYYYDLLQVRGKSIELLGIRYPLENIGINSYQGLDMNLTYQDNIGNFHYYISANWSQMASKVLYMDEQYKQEKYSIQTGQPVGAVYGLLADGFYNSVEEIENSPVIEGFEIQPGDIRYKDLNEDGVVNLYDHTLLTSDKPLSWYGITTGFEFRGFEFNIVFQGVYNRDIYVGDGILQAGFQSYGQSYGQAYSHMINRWTPETTETATYPRLSAGGNAYNLNPNYWYTSFWIKSGDYLRIKDLTVAYTFPESISKRLIGTELKVFISAQNLFTWSDYTITDPEVTKFSNYPMQRVHSIGLSIKF